MLNTCSTTEMSEKEILRNLPLGKFQMRALYRCKASVTKLLVFLSSFHLKKDEEEGYFLLLIINHEYA